MHDREVGLAKLSFYQTRTRQGAKQKRGISGVSQDSNKFPSVPNRTKKTKVRINTVSEISL